MKNIIGSYLKFESCVQLHHDAMRTQKKTKHTTKFYEVNYQIDTFTERICLTDLEMKRVEGLCGTPGTREIRYILPVK